VNLLREGGRSVLDGGTDDHQVEPGGPSVLRATLAAHPEIATRHGQGHGHRLEAPRDASTR
jgi:hypothetical protein